jgi:UDP-N-acetylmuramoyl-tripeptide--D-alanyl-D-alanine ligase
MNLTAGELVHATGGSLVAGDAEALATSYTIDSRLAEPGACFFALRADRDGHEFVPDAFARGASVAVVDRDVTGPTPTGAVVRVAETMTALQTLAALARGRLRDADVVGITGSAGKTATKDLTAAAVGAGRRVHASPGSFNNEAGVPLTLLGAPVDTEVVVAEMGARFEGNIADLAAFAHPSIGVVTNVGLAHAGHLGGAEGITRVKGELVEALPDDGLAILNDDCPSVEVLAERTRARVLRVGSGDGADVQATVAALDDELRPTLELRTPWGATTTRLTLRGAHQSLNAGMAVAVAGSLGVPLDAAAAALADAGAASHRMELLHAPGGLTVLNDAYNSSPTAAAAALRALGALPADGRRIAVIGDMLELGDHADPEHEAIGALAAELGLDLVVAVGAHRATVGRGAAPAVPTIEVADAREAVAVLASEVRDGDAVLVKASRAIGLEAVVDALLLRGTRAGSSRP